MFCRTHELSSRRRRLLPLFPGVRAVLLLLGILTLSPGAAAAEEGPSSPLEPVVERLRSLIRTEIDRGLVKGASIAVVDEDRVLWAEGLGLADVEKGAPAGVDTIYRVGSVSKLFTALSVMSLEEQGRLDIDEPIERYYPGFRIDKGDFPEAGATTLRQLMTHRSGFPRESPIGSYFDPSEPGLEATVRSIGSCALAIEPESKTKYSNIAVALEGYVAARVAGTDFATFQQQTLLEPLGMEHSSFRLDEELKQKLAAGYLRLEDGREIRAPVFEFGVGPAANLYSSVEDMARFLQFLLREGRSESGERILRASTLREMFRVQYAGDAAASGFGLGFYVGQIAGHRWVGHGGAVYGFATQLLFSPEEGLGVIVCANQDIANGFTGAVARRAFLWTLASRNGEDLPASRETIDLPDEALRRFVGTFRAERGWLEISLKGRHLSADLMGQKMDLRPATEERLLAYGDSWYAEPLEISEDGRTVLFSGSRYSRMDPADSEPEKAGPWKEYVGTYGPSFIPTVLEIRQGKLVATVENAFGYILQPEGPDTFLFTHGLYEDERLTFLRDERGVVERLRIGPVEFERGARTAISPGDVWALWAVIIVWVAVSIAMEQRYRWVAKVSGPVLVMLGAIALVNLRILPQVSPVYDVIGNYVVPICIPLLLFRANIFTILKESGPMFLAFHLSALGTVIGAAVATLVFRDSLERVPEMAGIMTGSYTGGSVNFLALQRTFDPGGEWTGVINSLIVADNLVMALVFFLCFALVSVRPMRRIYGTPYEDEAERSHEQGDSPGMHAASYWKPKPISLLDIARALAIAVAVAAVSHLAADFFRTGDLPGWVRLFLGQPYLLITVICVFLASTFHERLERVSGPEELGTFMIYLFFFAIGTSADVVTIVREVPVLFVFCGIMAFFNLVTALGLGYLFRRNLEEIALGCNATLGGAPSAAAMAIAKGWRPLVLPAILVGIWGYVAGTHLGFLVGQFLLSVFGSS